MSNLKAFRDSATREEQDDLAKKLGTNSTYLFNQLGVHRRIQVEKAAIIEKATIEIARQNSGRTPVIPREALCEACAQCPHACATRAARGGA